MKGFEVILALKNHITDNDIVVSSNGNISREAYHFLPQPQVYLRGSMGLPVAVGIGMALAKPTKRIIVITGDGNFLMGLNSAATAAFYQPANLKILILDNQKYFTTGGQQTVSSVINYSEFLDSLNIDYTNSKQAKPNQIESVLEEFLKATTIAVLHLAIEEGKQQLENIPWHPKLIAKKMVSKLSDNQPKNLR